ncbi:MAG: hypothetical protein ACUVWZ_02720 [Anaerolineae bacterium]
MLLDTGDALVGGGLLGDRTQGQAVVAAMNLIGYDAMALGPNELSLGPELLRRRMQEAEFPMLSANVVVSGTEDLFAEPTTVLVRGGYRLGVLGLTRPVGGPRSGFDVRDPYQATVQYVSELAERTELVIVLTNLEYQAAFDLANRIPGIDLVIAALPNAIPQQALQAPETGTLVVTADQPFPGHSGRRVGRLIVIVEGDGIMHDESWESVAMDGTIADDPQMEKLLDRFRP